MKAWFSLVFPCACFLNRRLTYITRYTVGVMAFWFVLSLIVLLHYEIYEHELNSVV